MGVSLQTTASMAWAAGETEGGSGGTASGVVAMEVVGGVPDEDVGCAAWFPGGGSEQAARTARAAAAHKTRFILDLIDTWRTIALVDLKAPGAARFLGRAGVVLAVLALAACGGPPPKAPEPPA